MNIYWGSGVIAPRIRNFGTRWRWVVSFTSQPLHPGDKSERSQLPHCAFT